MDGSLSVTAVFEGAEGDGAHGLGGKNTITLYGGNEQTSTTMFSKQVALSLPLALPFAWPSLVPVSALVPGLACSRAPSRSIHPLTHSSRWKARLLARSQPRLHVSCIGF